MALETYRHDICEGAGLKLDDAIERISTEDLTRHGLLGRPLRFKLLALNQVARRDGKVRRPGSRTWLGRMFDAIDAILDSLIQASGGEGGLIKEFKDILSALR